MAQSHLTSANLTGLAPCINAQEVTAQLAEHLGFIVADKVGELAQPTTIRDALTGKSFR